MAEENPYKWEPVQRSVSLLHPLMRVRVGMMLNQIEREYNDINGSYHHGKRTTSVRITKLKIFETYRTPSRQEYLFYDRVNGKRVTQVRAWLSSHQHGLAVDFAGQNPDGSWTWDENEVDYEYLKKVAEHCGLGAPIDWDPGHIEHPIWPAVRNMMKQPPDI